VHVAQPVALWGPSSLRSPLQRNRKTKETKRTRSVKHCPRGSTSGPVGAALFTPPTVTEKSKDKRNKKNAGSRKHCARGSASGAVGAEFTPVTVTEKSKDKRNKKNAVSETLSTWLNQWPCGGCAVHSTNCDREIERQKKQKERGVTETLCTWLSQWRCGGPVHSGHRGREIEKTKETKRQWGQ
jgi:hypothetical protein